MASVPAQPRVALRFMPVVLAAKRPRTESLGQRPWQPDGPGASRRLAVASRGTRPQPPLAISIGEQTKQPSNNGVLSMNEQDDGASEIPAAPARVTLSEWSQELAEQQLRAAFEAWVISVDHEGIGWVGGERLARASDGHYLDPCVQGLWVGNRRGAFLCPVIVPAAEPDNLRSHRDSWISALERLVELEPRQASPDAEDTRAYWQHELRALTAMYADLDACDAKREACRELLEQEIASILRDVLTTGWRVAEKYFGSEPFGDVDEARRVQEEQVQHAIKRLWVLSSGQCSQPARR